MIDSISFVISTTGKRTRLLPAVFGTIRDQKIPDYEIIVAGVVDELQGQCSPDVKLVPEPLPAHGLKFFWPWGFKHVTKKWVAVMGDDFVLKPGWYDHIKNYDAQGDVIGCACLNPDDSIYCLMTDAFEPMLTEDKMKVGPATAFALYLVSKEVIDKVPLDPYCICHDKKWGYDIHIAGFKKAFCRAAEVVHLGSAEQFGGFGNVKYDQFTKDEQKRFGFMSVATVVQRCRKCGCEDREVIIIQDVNTIVDKMVHTKKEDLNEPGI